MIDRPPPSGPSTPARLLKQGAVVYVFSHLVGISLLAITDAQHDAYYFRAFALGLIWASASLVVSTYLNMRRAWQGQPLADFRDGILPAVAIFALGWGIWSVVHYLAAGNSPFGG